MSKPRYRFLRLLLLPLIVFLINCNPGEQSASVDRITLLGSTATLTPGSTASFLVLVRNPYTRDPESERPIRIQLGAGDAEPVEVFAGESDDAGLVQVSFPVPQTVDDPYQTLTVQAGRGSNMETYTQDVYVGQTYDVLLATDKPVYQPGQVLHVRALALDSTALKAARNEPLVVVVTDPQGNKLLREELTTSDFGVAAVDFTLDAQAPSGDYILTAEMGPNTSTRSVEVKPYTLPRFEVTFTSDKPFYLPGETATGTVSAQYFFGKPVAGGHVTLKGYVQDVERAEVLSVEGTTGADGLFHYKFAVPDYFVGQLENDSASVDLEIAVADTAQHVERIDESVTVAEQPILVDAVPESGELRRGLENLVYIDTSYPDGSAAKTTLTVESNRLPKPLTVATDEYGLAVITMTGGVASTTGLKVTAVDESGLTATQRVLVEGSPAKTAVLLRPDKSEYAVGETMNLDVFVTGKAQTVYLDVVKGNQTYGLEALPVQDGLAQAAIPVDGSMLGTIELHAYVITDGGDIVRDRRLALVNPAPAAVEVTADAEVYRPGATATLDIAVARDGAPMPGVVGVSIVDESVFSVGAQDPGFARTYFLLERELQEPRYEIHDFTKLESDDPSPYDQEAARQAALAGLFAQELALAGRAEPASAPAAQPLIPASVLAYAARFSLALPLLGLAFYDGTRRRRRLLLTLLVIGTAGFVLASCAAGAAPAPAAAPAAEAPAAVEGAGSSAPSPGAPPRLRQFFPETLFWLAEAPTDADGRVQLEVPIADSITTWRVSVVASDQDANLGSAETGLRVFQDFFVEPDVPRFLTVGDELEIPVSIYNYLDEPQTVRLDVAPDDWFELAGDAAITAELDANEVAAAYIPVRVVDFGQRELRVTATGSAMSDAVLRQVEVLPDGMAQHAVVSGQLQPAQTIPMAVPEEAIPGTARITVKVYPGVVSQVLGGLEGLLQQPYGCFEQTSSTTYPNVMVLDYLKTTGQAVPQVQLRAEQFIGLGYQRLLTFEVDGAPGGFSLFGDPPPQTMLTAYGLMEFEDMSKVSYVDPALIQRTADFLMGQQNSDGSWGAAGMTIESGIERMGDADLGATAYVAWALADAGYGDSAAVQRALDFIQTQMAAAERTTAETSRAGASSKAMTSGPTSQTLQVPAGMDNYTLALVANALVAAGDDATAVLDELAARAQAGGGEMVFWATDQNTWLDSYGPAATIETTALVAQAFLRSGTHLDLAQQALNFLASQRDALGAYGTTQATVQALKALVLAAELGDEGGAATVTIQLSDGRKETIDVDEGDLGVVQQVTFDDLVVGEQPVAIMVDGDRTLQYQVVADYYVPWSALPPAAEEAQPLRVDVEYDRTELAVNDEVGVHAEVELLEPGTAGTLLVDLGVPPGFSVMTEDLDRLVEEGAIDRYELTGRQIIFYLTNVPSSEVIDLDYRLLARFPLKAQTPASAAYNYYAPEQRTTATPQRIVVTLGTPKPIKN
jgi:hypothetical protein